MHYGHGYIFFVEQGNAKFGEVIPGPDLLVPFTSPNGFNWVGYGLPGDSGSGVMNDAGLAVGDLTHGIGVAGVPVPGPQLRHRHGRDLQPDRLELQARHRRRPARELRGPDRHLRRTARGPAAAPPPARAG